MKSPSDIPVAEGVAVKVPGQETPLVPSSAGAAEWRTGLCGCFEDCAICCSVCCCHPITVGQIYERTVQKALLKRLPVLSCMSIAIMIWVFDISQQVISNSTTGAGPFDHWDAHDRPRPRSCGAPEYACSRRRDPRFLVVRPRVRRCVHRAQCHPPARGNQGQVLHRGPAVRGCVLRLVLQPVHAVHDPAPREDGLRREQRLLGLLADCLPGLSKPGPRGESSCTRCWHASPSVQQESTRKQVGWAWEVAVTVADAEAMKEWVGGVHCALNPGSMSLFLID
eukprot:scaffold81145_cov64-Phaeocystis_antarctica.AAC.4